MLYASFRHITHTRGVPYHNRTWRDSDEALPPLHRNFSEWRRPNYIDCPVPQNERIMTSVPDMTTADDGDLPLCANKVAPLHVQLAPCNEKLKLCPKRGRVLLDTSV